jgi:hypothetical protein
VEENSYYELLSLHSPVGIEKKYENFNDER